MKAISQSFMKHMRSYIEGKECGNILQAIYIDGKELDLFADSKDVKLGIYFEYILSQKFGFPGTLPKSGKVPMPDLYAKALHKPLKDITVADMLAPYQLAHTNADRVVSYFKMMGIKVLACGEKLEKDGYEGTIDLRCEATKTIKFNDGFVLKKGTIFVVDVKYSGWIGKDYQAGEHGWKWDDVQKKYHGTQAKQYSFLSGVEVFFLVVSSKNDSDIEFFRTVLDEFAIEQHLLEGKSLKDQLEFHSGVSGFEARPELTKCAECPLREKCKDRHDFPQIKSVNLKEE